MMSVPETLLLIRHGQTDWNRRGLVQGQTDVPLDAVGKEQARRLARRLSELDLSALHASPLARAAETADVIAQAVGLEPVYSSAWCEMPGRNRQATSASSGWLIGGLRLVPVRR